VVARTNIIFTRLDTAPLNDDEFSYQMENWLSVIVDVINEDLGLIESSFVRGTVTLTGTTTTVLTDSVNTGDTIFFSLITPVNPGFLSYSIVDGVSFTITSTSGTDGSTLSYMITKI
jgi:hypothetical protein